MASGKRHENETFKEYRERLKAEQEWLDNYLKGAIIYLSSVIAPSKDKIGMPLRESDKHSHLFKFTVNGPYRKDKNGIL